MAKHVNFVGWLRVIKCKNILARLLKELKRKMQERK
jgi:hypothetical protein